MPDWFNDLFAEHVGIALVQNWNKSPPDYSEAAERLWQLMHRRQYYGETAICPVGQEAGKGHSLAWLENGVYGNPQTGGLWSCYDCGKKYTRYDGAYVAVDEAMD